jgi:hypothetical protein
VTEAKKFACDGCGALMVWDAEGATLRCPFCAGTKGVPVRGDYVAVEHALENAPDSSKRLETPRVLSCDRCGAKVAVPERVTSLSCAFCGSEQVLETKGEAGRIRPESVVPFAVGAAQAQTKFREWLGKGIFRPKSLRDVASVEAMKGVYVPFWTYDTNTWSRWTAEAGYHYTVHVPVTVRTGESTHTEMRAETRTRWEPAAGERRDSYDDVLVCASVGIDEGRLSGTYPYRLEEVEPYRSEFLAGWAAEEYAVDLPEGWRRARERVNEEEVEKCSDDVPGDEQRNLRVWTQHAGVTWKHLLLPLWIATYFYGKKRYHVLVNGQTGKVAGTKPVSWWRVGAAILLAIAVGAVVTWLVRR